MTMIRRGSLAGSLFALLIALAATGARADTGKPLILQELAWPDVEAYLKTSDLAMLPMGSTEQHGPHLPLGADWLETMSICKEVSARTGVLVAPVVMAGYSEYHTGFPGTLSLKTETLAQVLFETAETLMRYGFRRFVLINFHGGNMTAGELVVHRINQGTPGMAVLLDEEKVPLAGPKPAGQVNDPHAGVDETSNLLYLHPDLVRMERAKKPVMTFGPVVRDLIAVSREHPELNALGPALSAVPRETGKGGSMREISSNGSWTDRDPRTATAALGKQIMARYVDSAVAFIEAWKLVKAKPAAMPKG